jgi:hypothetical protein
MSKPGIWNHCRKSRKQGAIALPFLAKDHQCIRGRNPFPFAKI